MLSHLSIVELVLEEETNVRELVRRKLLVDGVDLREFVADDFEVREGTVRTWLECKGVAAQRWIKVDDRDSHRGGPNARTSACLYVGDSCLCHESFLFIPERLKIQVIQFSSSTPMGGTTFLHVVEDGLGDAIVSEVIRLTTYQPGDTASGLKRTILHRRCPV
jgi:hypothetical protein